MPRIGDPTSTRLLSYIVLSSPWIEHIFGYVTAWLGRGDCVLNGWRDLGLETTSMIETS